MVCKKKSVINKNEFLAASLVLIAISFMVFVFAATEVKSPETLGNYSTNMLLNCTTSINASDVSYNVTFYYNASGGATGISVNLTSTIWNDTAEDGVFNVTTDISWLGDVSKSYNITCYADNGTNQEFAAATVNITVDNTLPKVSAANFTTPITLTNYSGTTVFNITTVDITSEVASIVFNVTNISGVQVATATASNPAGNVWNSTLDTSTLTEGWFNVTAIVTDHAGNINDTAVILNVILDGTPPAVTNFANTVNNGNYSDSIVLNVSVTDGGMGIHTVYFNITNSTGEQHNFTGASTPGGGYYNITLDTTVFTDGVYNITVYSNDTELDNLNSTEVISVTFDNTLPKVSAANFTTPITLTNYSGTTVFNITTVDITSEVASIVFNVTNISGVQVATATASNPAGNVWNSTLDTSTLTEGWFNVTAIVTDHAGNINDTAVILNVILDGTPPAVTSFANTVNNGNYSDSIVLNVSVTDGGMGVNASIVYFNITNSTGDQHNFTGASTPGGDYYNITLDTTVFTDGVYNITVWANDTELNNLNNTEVISVTFDNTAPSAVILTSSSTTQTSLILTIAITDALSGIGSSCTTDRSGASISGITVSQTLTETGLSCGTSYQYVVQCTDAAGNSEYSSQTSFTTSACGTGGSAASGGGVTATWANTYTISDEQFEQGYTKELGANNRVRVRVTGSGGAIETHYVGVKEVTETAATIEIASEPVEVKLEIGEDAKVDVTDDGYYDIYVKLNSITSGKADITVQSIYEVIPEGEEAVTTTGEIVEGEEEEIPEVEEEKDLTWLWVLIGILILAVVIGGGIAVRKNK